MMEPEWANSDRPDLMLPTVPFHHSHAAWRRKWRLFVCACCRQVADLMADPACRHAVEVAERHAAGLAGPEERDEARWALLPTREFHAAGPPSPLARLAACAGVPTADLRSAADQAAAAVARLRTQARLGPTFQKHLAEEWRRVRSGERAALAGLARCVFGSPPLTPRPFDPAWLAWGGGLVARMGQDIYDEHAFEQLPVLADALEDAGCTDAELIGHLRGVEGHVRGCWAVDLILNKK